MTLPEQAAYWFGVFHAVIYILLGAVFAATWVMHRVLRYLGIWKMVIQGLHEKAKRDRMPGA
jgi:hypothetical protein